MRERAFSLTNSSITNSATFPWSPVPIAYIADYHSDTIARRCKVTVIDGKPADLILILSLASRREAHACQSLHDDAQAKLITRR